MKRRIFHLKPIMVLVLALSFTGCTKDFMDQQKEFYGTVVDYTGFDGCGFIIELDGGQRLEPVELADTGFIFRDGQRVAVTYTPLDLASICMVGPTVRIETIRQVGCLPIRDLPITFAWGDLPNDPFTIHSAAIVGDCLRVKLSYSGGCKTHQYSVFKLPVFCGTPPVPPPTLVMCHEAHGDLCEAAITETISVDLTSLQDPAGHTTHFVLTLNYEGSDYQETFTYKY
jgi:hypothetical protein